MVYDKWTVTELISAMARHSRHEYVGADVRIGMLSIGGFNKLEQKETGANVNPCC